MKTWHKMVVGVASILLAGLLVPEHRVIPVLNATSADWNPDTFWYEPWGRSGVHKGIDIFASAGTSVIASTNMLLIYRGSLSRGGNVVLGLGPKWRLHYYAHLETLADSGIWAKRGRPLGTVGDTGNAQGKPPHLHYSIVSLLPVFWRMDDSTQGYKKAFYLNPIEYFNQ